MDRDFKDQVLICVDCGSQFTFSAGEKAFYRSKIPPLCDPKRCLSCRHLRKQTINNSQETQR